MHEPVGKSPTVSESRPARLADPMAAELFPDLHAERARLAFSRSSRDRMVELLGALDPDSAADEITKEYIEVTVADALEDLRGPGAGDFFGRIDEWYIGRRHIEDEHHDPVVVDWRAPIAAPFYRATSVDPLGVDFRRRFMLDDGDLIAYLDEHLDDPDEGEVAGGIPDPVLAEIGAERSGEMREIVSTIQAEQDIVIRSSIDQVLVVQGGPGTGKTAVALHRVAYLLFEHRGRLARDGVLVVGPNEAFLDYISNVLPSLGERTVRQATADELCIPRVEVTGVDGVELARWKGHADRIGDIEAVAVAAIRAPDDDIRATTGQLFAVTAALAVATRHRRRVSAIVAPSALHAAIGRALAEHGLHTVHHVHDLDADELPVFDPERVKGLEFDGVIVVNPHEILGEGTIEAVTARGARLLYVAMTRAVQELHFVTDAEPPVVLDAPR